jgi:hypothetical protein
MDEIMKKFLEIKKTMYSNFLYGKDVMMNILSILFLSFLVACSGTDVGVDEENSMKKIDWLVSLRSEKVDSSKIASTGSSREYKISIPNHKELMITFSDRPYRLAKLSGGEKLVKFFEIGRYKLPNVIFEHDFKGRRWSSVVEIKNVYMEKDNLVLHIIEKDDWETNNKVSNVGIHEGTMQYVSIFINDMIPAKETSEDSNKINSDGKLKSNPNMWLFSVRNEKAQIKPVAGSSKKHIISLSNHDQLILQFTVSPKRKRFQVDGKTLVSNFQEGGAFYGGPEKHPNAIFDYEFDNGRWSSVVIITNAELKGDDLVLHVTEEYENSWTPLLTKNSKIGIETGTVADVSLFIDDASPTNACPSAPPTALKPEGNPFEAGTTKNICWDDCMNAGLSKSYCKKIADNDDDWLVNDNHCNEGPDGRFKPQSNCWCSTCAAANKAAVGVAVSTPNADKAAETVAETVADKASAADKAAAVDWVCINDCINSGRLKSYCNEKGKTIEGPNYPSFNCGSSWCPACVAAKKDPSSVVTAYKTAADKAKAAADKAAADKAAADKAAADKAAAAKAAADKAAAAAGWVQTHTSSQTHLDCKQLSSCENPLDLKSAKTKCYSMEGNCNGFNFRSSDSEVCFKSCEKDSKNRTIPKYHATDTGYDVWVKNLQVIYSCPKITTSTCYGRDPNNLRLHDLSFVMLVMGGVVSDCINIAVTYKFLSATIYDEDDDYEMSCRYWDGIYKWGVDAYSMQYRFQKLDPPDSKVWNEDGSDWVCTKSAEACTFTLK